MTETTFMLELNSDPKNISKIEPYVHRIVQKYKVDDDIYGNMLISLTEAVNNAIIHGNRNVLSKMVRINFLKERKRVSFLVQDEGAGFDYKNLPDPTRPENLLKIGGRGVFLMKELADYVIFSDEGKSVELQFKI